jgi:hypothetical protein
MRGLSRFLAGCRGSDLSLAERDTYGVLVQASSPLQKGPTGGLRLNPDHSVPVPGNPAHDNS